MTISCAGLAGSAALVILGRLRSCNSAVMRAFNVPDGLQWTDCKASTGRLAANVCSSSHRSSLQKRLPFLGSRLSLDGRSRAGAGSWIATFCCVISTRRLLFALSAQLIVAEAVLGLTCGLMFEQRVPSTVQVPSMALQIFEVCFAIAVFKKRCLQEL